MEKKFTQGEWSVRGNKVWVGDTYVSIATVHVVKNHKDVTFEPIEDIEAIANAKLISAAPDLLDALQSLMDDMGGGTKFCDHDHSCVCAWDKAKLAIQKAL